MCSSMFPQPLAAHYVCNLARWLVLSTAGWRLCEPVISLLTEATAEECFYDEMGAKGVFRGSDEMITMGSVGDI